MRKFYFTFIACILYFTTAAQDVQSYLFPEIAYKTSVTKTINYTVKAENFLPLLANERRKIDYKNTDLQQFFGFKFNPYWKTSLGYQYRVTAPGKQHHRLIQQLAYTTRNTVPISHRVRTDQTFSLNNKTTWRLRYRLSAQLPLNGKQLNVDEFYMKLQNEVLTTNLSLSNNFENRFGANIGFVTAAKHKYETGFNFRTIDVFEGENKHQLLLQIGIFLNE